MTSDIDFVQLWVDDSDKDWRLEKSKYVPGFNADSSSVRYRDWDNLQYWFRGIEKYAPWVRKVHLITCGHYPKWLNLNHPKLNFVKHSDYMSADCLPTFSSRAIIINIHKIKELSDKFVFFNDDMFIVNNVKESDFFRKGLPCDYAIMNCLIPRGVFSYTDFNNISLVNKYFKKNEAIKKNLLKWYNPAYGIMNFNNMFFLPWTGISRFISRHLPLSFLKKNFQDVWEIEGQWLDKVSHDKFRSKEGLNEWLFRYWRLMKGEFSPSKPLGKKFGISNDGKNNALIYNSIKKQKYKIICVNDEEGNDNINFEAEKQNLKNAFEHIFPEKSSFEV